MHIFLNEISLENQFNTMEEFKVSLQEVYVILDSITTIDIQKHIFITPQFWFQNVINGEMFSKTLNKLSDKSLRAAFINILKNKLNAITWEANRMHNSSDVYKCNKQYVTNSSIAEITERNHSDRTGKYLLVNFPNSRFSKSKLRVLKVGFFRAFIYGASTFDDFGFWAAHNSLITPRYDDSSTRPPRDFHTVLSDTTKFRKTSIPAVQGRSVYEEISSGRFYYVDNKHCGRSAHLEVFDRQQRHLGNATLDGYLVPGTAKSRTL